MTQPGEGSFSWRAALAGDLRRYRLLTRGCEPDRLGPGVWLLLLSPRMLPNLLLRSAHKLACWRLAPLAKAVSLIVFFLFGIEVAVRCRIGPGLFLPHTQGTVIGAERVGRDVTIYQGVTLGARELDFGFSEGSRPVIGDGVIIGSGAKILGDVMIGDGARVGTNATIIASVPAGAIALGPVATIRPAEAKDIK